MSLRGRTLSASPKAALSQVDEFVGARLAAVGLGARDILAHLRRPDRGSRSPSDRPAGRSASSTGARRRLRAQAQPFDIDADQVDQHRQQRPGGSASASAPVARRHAAGAQRRHQVESRRCCEPAIQCAQVVGFKVRCRDRLRPAAPGTRQLRAAQVQRHRRVAGQRARVCSAGSGCGVERQAEALELDWRRSAFGRPRQRGRDGRPAGNGRHSCAGTPRPQRAPCASRPAHQHSSQSRCTTATLRMPSPSAAGRPPARNRLGSPRTCSSTRPARPPSGARRQRRRLQRQQVTSAAASSSTTRRADATRSPGSPAANCPAAAGCRRRPPARTGSPGPRRCRRWPWPDSG
jgi:hypothetical protein